MRANRGFTLPVVVLSLLVIYVVLLAGHLRREDLAALTDRAEARLALAGHLASAADECWWQLTSGKQGAAFQDLFDVASPDPLAYRASFEPALTRAGLPVEDGTTVAAAQVAVPSFRTATGRLPQGLIHLTVTGRTSLRRGRASLALHQLRRFWVYQLDGSYASGPMFTREIVAQWVEEV